jgi:molybdate transport system substrate-binding protein
MTQRFLRRAARSRFTAAFAFFFAVLSQLAGCEKKESQSPAAESHLVRAAAASDLKFALGDVIAGFEKEHSQIHVEATFGSSGNFYAQLTNKAPFDLFLSADVDYPRKLVDAGLADGAGEFRYAIGQVVVWVRNESKLDLEQLGIKAVLDPSVNKIAIANPAHAPYGRAAEAALKSSGVYDEVKDRLVLGDNVAQTAQFIESGAADVGLIAHSLALSPTMKDKGRFWTIPQDAYPRLDQGGVILSWAADRASAEAFRAFLIGAGGREILVRFGFKLPEE